MTADMMKRTSIILRVMIMALLAHACVVSISAQEFKVESFKELPNDISAFINPVKDLNDEGCAIVKVIASSADFAFSTPLGIAKRIDKTGEIWLYLPRGSKKITLKHPQWGVMRDYAFPSRLESHKTYELCIIEPSKNLEIAYTTPIVTTIRDTLVVTRVDTLVIKPTKPKIPFETDLLLTACFGGKASYLAGGLMATFMRRHGGFIHLSTDFGATGKLPENCDKHGMIDGAQRFYSGDTKRKSFMATAGASHRIGAHFVVFEGVGYSANTLAWELAQSEGGGYVRNSYYSHSGVTAEAGAQFRFKRITIAASVITVKGSEWFGSVGIGIRLGNHKKN